MASVCKGTVGRSPYWYCCYTTADGRRIKRTSKQRNKQKAMEFCLSLDRAERMAAQGILTEARARELIQEMVERTTGETVPFYTVVGWFKEWLNGKKFSQAKGTHSKYTHLSDMFIRHLGSRATLNIAVITTKDISSFRDAQLASGKHPNTVTEFVTHLRIPFNAARRRGIIAMSPADAVELPVPPRPVNGAEEATKDVFSPEQVRALLDAAITKEHGRYVFDAGEDWKGAILVAYYTGARLGDVSNLIWSSVDLVSKVIRYRAQKTGKHITVPLHPELILYFNGLVRPDNDKAFVFPNIAGRGSGGRSGLSMCFARIMSRAKIVPGVIRAATEGGKGRTVNSLSFHSLRHSFNSAMANAGVAQEIRMKLTGHASVKMNAHYTHHELEPLRGAVGVLPMLST